MTPSRDDVIRMAHEAGMDSTSGWRDNGETDTYYEAWPEQLERFAALVAAPLQAEIDAMLGLQVPTPEDVDSQYWGRMDGATAFHVIQRHADYWHEAGRMMHAWLDAAVAAEREACAALAETHTTDLTHCKTSAHAADMTAVAIGRAIRARSTKP